MNELISERVRISLDEHGVARVTLTRPDKLNALDAAMFGGIIDAIELLRHERKLRAVVLHGEGRAFCAGLDMGSFGRMADTADGGGGAEVSALLARSHGLANRAQQVAWGWRQLPVPVIAAVHGAAFGGGLQMALGADVRCVGTDVQMSVMEIKWGLVPDMAGIVLMSELMRADIVRELTFSGRIVGALEAQAIGLATQVCDDPLDAALSLARRIAASSPDAIRAAKRLLNGASPLDAAAVLRAESIEQKRLIGSPNQAEAVHAAMARRAPVFSDPSE